MSFGGPNTRSSLKVGTRRPMTKLGESPGPQSYPCRGDCRFARWEQTPCKIRCRKSPVPWAKWCERFWEGNKILPNSKDQ